MVSQIFQELLLEICFCSFSPPAAEYALVVNYQFGPAYFPVLAYGILGKGGLFVTPPIEDCLTGLTGSSTRAETGCAELHSSVADCQALT